MNGKLDKSTPVPLYVQLSEVIERAIRDGRYSQGSKIPTEQELMKIYDVSRVTVRQTMNHLISRGLIIRKQGIGSFVANQIVSQSMNEIIGFYPFLISKGGKLQTRIISYDFVLPDKEVREHLNLGEEERVLELVRQFFIEEKLKVVDRVYIPYEIAGHWSKEDALEKGSFQLIRDKAGVRFNNSVIKIQASAASRQTADLLGIRKGEPVLELRRLTYSVQQKPVDYTIFYFPGESYELTAKILIGNQHWLELNKFEGNK